MLRVILDSNFLFIPLQFHVDVFEELERITGKRLEPILLSPVYEEVRAIAAKGGKLGKLAAAALKYAEKLRCVGAEVRSGESVDDLILRVASEWDCPVATNDRELRKRLICAKVTVIYLRQRSHLEVRGRI